MHDFNREQNLQFKFQLRVLTREELSRILSLSPAEYKVIEGNHRNFF